MQKKFGFHLPFWFNHVSFVNAHCIISSRIEYNILNRLFYTFFLFILSKNEIKKKVQNFNHFRFSFQYFTLFSIMHTKNIYIKWKKNISRCRINKLNFFLLTFYTECLPQNCSINFLRKIVQSSDTQTRIYPTKKPHWKWSLSNKQRWWLLSINVYLCCMYIHSWIECIYMYWYGFTEILVVYEC